MRYRLAVIPEDAQVPGTVVAALLPPGTAVIEVLAHWQVTEGTAFRGGISDFLLTVPETPVNPWDVHKAACRHCAEPVHMTPMAVAGGPVSQVWTHVASGHERCAGRETFAAPPEVRGAYGWGAGLPPPGVDGGEV